MEEIIDLIATNSSPSDISDAIKNTLYSKASEKVDSVRPYVASSIFGTSENESETTGDE
jgi:hypothetical protein